MKHSLRSWLWRVPPDQEIDEEIAFHIEMRTRELVERGMDRKTARATAIDRMGDLANLKHACVDLGRKRDREMRLTQWLDELRDDLRFALRQRKRSSGKSRPFRACEASPRRARCRWAIRCSGSRLS